MFLHRSSLVFCVAFWLAGSPTAHRAWAKDSPAQTVPRAMMKFVLAKEIPGYVTLLTKWGSQRQ